MFWQPDNPTKLKIQDNLLPLIGVKLIGNMIGPGTKLDFRKVLPWILAALVLSPGSLKQLGINVGGGATPGASRGLLGNLDTTTLLLIGGIIYFAVAKK